MCGKKQRSRKLKQGNAYNPFDMSKPTMGGADIVAVGAGAAAGAAIADALNRGVGPENE